MAATHWIWDLRTETMERTFEAFGTSTFNNVAGEMAALKGKGTYADYTSVAAPMDDKTLLYTSIMPGVSFHTQTNVAFPDDTHRTRTAYNCKGHRHVLDDAFAAWQYALPPHSLSPRTAPWMYN